uniref:Serpentine receptor class gamma n=1 Tax=Caenorhabditis tropicalis TaxID=1561998 RepID=A0A1I7T6U4_9PELO
MLGMVSTSPNCPIEAQWFVGIYTVVIYAPLAFVYVVVASLFIKHPNAFHPLFVISFFLILLAYTTSNFILFFRNLLEFFFINEFIFSVLEFILVSANYYTQPIVILALLERLAATVFVSNYEKSLQWIPYLIGQLICVSFMCPSIRGPGFQIIFVVLMSLSQHQAKLVNNIQVVLSVVICVCLVVLFLVNRYKTANSVGKSTLTTRYQLAENIKALRPNAHTTFIS